ncbi:MAG: tetratricopeptide repeat protein [Acidobacteriota bacterium]
MDIILAFFSLFTFGCFGFLPTALAAAAIVDILRVRAEWYWLLISLFIPVIGPLAYFAVSYGPWANRLGRISPAAARRAEAKRRLKELEIQLEHWRGPSILAEAGELLLSLGKTKRAEALLREAHGAGASPKECHLPLASVLQVKGKRWTEALPLLRELVDEEPDYKFGAARLALARTLDELGETEKAEHELRQVLVKRNPPEAKVRLARLLQRRGDDQEAAGLLAEVRADAAGMPPYLRREHGAWIRAAKRLKASTAALPSPRLEGLAPKAPFWKLGLAALVLMLAVVGVVGWIALQVMPFFETSEEAMELYGELAEATSRFDELRRDPADVTELERLELDEAGVVDLLDFRRALGEACAAASASLPDEAGDDGGTLRPADGTLRPADGEGDPFSEGLWRSNLQRHTRLANLIAGELELRGRVVEDFARHIALVDWRLLGRPEAMPFDLPEHFRADYAGARELLGREPSAVEEVGPEVLRIEKRQRASAQKKLEDLGALAADRELTEATRGRLEAERAALEASLEPGCLEPFTRLLNNETSSYYGDW